VKRKYNTKYVKRKSLQRGVVHLLPVLLVGVAFIAVLSFVFSKNASFSSLGKHLGPPPEDPEARKAWISENVDNSNHKDFIVIDYEVPSWEELDELNASLPGRNYPRYIKALQTYGTLPNLVEVLYFGDVIKDLGVNTEFVHANHWFKDGDLKLWYLSYDKPKDMDQDEARRALVHNILLARQQGLTVVLFPDYVQFEDGGMREMGISPQELSNYIEAVALDLAPLAEKYKAEYFAPVNQIEAIMDSNDYPVEETRNTMNAMYAKVVPQVRKLYSGKVMYKLGGFSRWENYEGVDLSGADIFGVTTCSRAPTPERVAQDVQESSAQAQKMSKKFGIPWFGAEFFISNEKDQMMTFGEVKESYPIEELYEVGLAQFNESAKSASGFTVHSLLGGGKIYDTPAYPLVKDFFANK